MVNQTASWTAFGVGLTTFLGTAGEIVTSHTTWRDFTTPLGVLHLIALGGAFVAMIGGALSAQLPRAGSHGERVTDPKPTLTLVPPTSPTSPLPPLPPEGL